MPGKLSHWLILAVLAAVLLKYYPLLSAEGTRLSRDWAETHQVDAIQVDKAIREGYPLPYWSPYTLGGSAVFAVPTKPYAYPPFILAVALFGPFLGMNILTLLHVLLGCLGMLWLMRRLGLGHFACLFSSFLFLFCAYPGSLFFSAPFWGYAVGWWPYAFLCVFDILQGKKWARSGLLLGALFALQLLAGGEFPLYWLGCFLGAFSLPYLITRRPWPVLGRLAAAGALAGIVFFGLSAVKLLPALEWMKTSGRQEALTDEEIFFGEPYRELVSKGPGALLKSLFMEKKRGTGLFVLPLLFVLGLATRFRERALWAAAAGTLFSLAIAVALIHDLVRDVLPGYDRMRMPYRFINVAGMGGILVAGYGLDSLWKFMNRFRPAVLKVAVAGLLFSGLLFHARLLPFVHFHPLAFTSYKIQHAIAEPVFSPILKDSRPGRIHSPTGGSQAIWTLLGLESVTGRLGGKGSGNAVFVDWLPQEKKAFHLTKEYAKVLDILNVRYLASRQKLVSRDLHELFVPEPVETGAGPGYSDAFAARVEPDGSGLDYCGYIGGLNRDSGRAVAVDTEGRAYIVGQACSGEDSFPVLRDSKVTHNGDSDAFVVRIKADGRALDLCGFLGGEGYDEAWDLSLDASGRACVAGMTASKTDGFPIRIGPGLSHNGGKWDAFAAMMGPPRFDGELDKLHAVPLRIVENRGQLEGDTRFYVQGAQKSVFFGPRGLTYLVSVDVERPGETGRGTARWCLKLNFVKPDPQARLKGRLPLSGRCHFLKGTPEEWKRSVPCFGKVIYNNIWPDVDLNFSLHKGRMKSVFLLGPGADPDRVHLAYRGASKLLITDEGSLALWVRGRIILQDAPVRAFQIRDGERIEVPASYKLLPSRRKGVHAYGFQLGDYDPDLPVHIDPDVLLYCGYLGGAGNDKGFAVAIDREGSAYVAGSTDSAQLECPGIPGLLVNKGKPDLDAFVAKVEPAGSHISYFTFFGGKGEDMALGIEVDGDGHAFVTGSTGSDGESFPVVEGPSAKFGGDRDAFIAKLSPDGSRLLYGGFIGGSGWDRAMDVAVDSEGRACVAGESRSDEKDFPVAKGPDLTFNGELDAFVARVHASGRSLDFCGYIGGEGQDEGHGVALDGEGGILVVGRTESEDAFPTKIGPDLTFNGGGMDGFIARLAMDGASLDYCGYIGGAKSDASYDVAVDKEGRAYVTGMTFSDERSFPVKRGPNLSFAQSTYRKHLAPFGSKIPFDPFTQPYLYERKTCLERISVFDDAVLVVGDAEARTRVLKMKVMRKNFDPHGIVFVEHADEEKSWPDEEDLNRFGSVLFADRSIDDPQLEEWFKAVGRGEISVWKETGTIWRGTPLEGERLEKVEPLEPERYVNRINDIEVDLEGVEGRFLLISEVFTLHPGWEAFIDDEPVPMFRADGLITAVPLPPDAKRVLFTFTPPGFVTGAVISIVMLILVTGIIFRRTNFFVRRKNSSGEKL